MTSARFGFLRSWVRTLVLGLLGGVFIGLVLGAALVVVLDLRAPVQIGDIREVDGVAVRGGRLDLLVRMDRAQDCVNVTTRFLWTWTEVDGQRVRMFVSLGSATMGVLPLVGKDQRFVLSVPIPSDLPEGEWFYRSRAVDTCLGLFQIPVSTARETPDIPVRIVARDAVTPSSKPLPEQLRPVLGEARPHDITRSLQEVRP